MSLASAPVRADSDCQCARPRRPSRRLIGAGRRATGIRGSEHSQRQARDFELGAQARRGRLSLSVSYWATYKQLPSHSDYPPGAAQPGVPIEGALPLVLKAAAVGFTWRLAAALKLASLVQVTVTSSLWAWFCSLACQT